MAISSDIIKRLDESTLTYNSKAMSDLNISDFKSDILSFDNNMIPYVKANRHRVMVITPFISEKLQNKSKLERYNKNAMYDSLKQNEAPLSNQSMYINLSGTSGTKVEHDVSFIIQMNWMMQADIVAFYIDLGITPAMESMLNFCLKRKIKTQIRKINTP